MVRTPSAAATLAGLLLIAGAQAAWADKVDIRAAAHDGFGRVAFDWPNPVTYDARVDGDTLTIKFARPVEGSLDALRKDLAEYIASASLQDGGKTLVAHLKRQMTANAFVAHDKTIVVDLTPAAAPKQTAPKQADAKPAPKASPPKQAEAKPDPKAEAKAPAPAPKQADAKPDPKAEAKAQAPAKPAAPAAPAVKLSATQKDGVAHIEFMWRHGVRAALVEKNGKARLTFSEPGTIDAQQLTAALPGLAPAVAIEGGKTALDFTLPKGVTAHAARRGDAVTLDVRGMIAPPSDKEPPKPVAAAAPQPAPAPAPPQQVAAQTAPAPNADQAEAAPPPPPPASVPVRFTATDGNASLRFDWPVATGAAIFQRGGELWVVFNVPTALDLNDPKTNGQAAVRAIDQVEVKGATVVHLKPVDGMSASVRRAGTAWILDFGAQPANVDAPIMVEPQPGAAPASTLFHVHQASAPVTLHDPDVGALVVVPVAELGRGIVAPPNEVDFRGLPTLQGIVLRPLVDDLAVHIDPDDVQVTRPGGLELSSDADRLLGKSPEAAHTLFDFEAWRGPKDVDYIDERQSLEHAIAIAKADAKTQPRLALARFYFAFSFAPEALAVLDSLAADDPATMLQPQVHALKGAACLLTDDRKCAGDELGISSLDGDPEANLWRASLAAANGDEAGAAKGFLDSVNLLPSYPPTLMGRFALQAARAMIDIKEPGMAGPLLDLVRRGRADPADKAIAVYLDGRRLQALGDLDGAVKQWDAAAGMGDPATRARALYAKAMALYDAKRATRPDTIKALDALRFAWRGDQFEFTLLRQLGEMQLAEGDDDSGLDALYQAAVNFPDLPASKDVAKETGDEYASLFLSPKGNDLPPLKALALYDGFHDIEPAGERSDKIVKTLIDRLVSVDLLDRAAGLLDTQVSTRLSGLDKARGATQLALLRLMNHEPDVALKALDTDVGTDLPPELVSQRTQLRARVLMEMNKDGDALALIKSDPSRDADRLRADIYWHDRNWVLAAQILGRLAGPPPADNKLDPATARVVVSLAAALTLDDDHDALAKLRTDFGAAMAGSRYADAFHVLAGDGTTAAANDPQALASQVAQIGELQNFMAAYKDKLASNGKPGVLN